MTVGATRTVDGMRFTQEERGVAIVGHDLQGYCIEATLDAAVAAYRKHCREARRLFRARAPFSSLVRPIARQVTLHWLYVYSVNRQPLSIAASDWAHPQSWRIIQNLVQSKFGTMSPRAVATCARLMGISEREYRSWHESNELFEMR